MENRTLTSLHTCGEGHVMRTLNSLLATWRRRQRVRHMGSNKMQIDKVRTSMEIESDDQGSQVVSVLMMQVNNYLTPRPNN